MIPRGNACQKLKDTEFVPQNTAILHTGNSKKHPAHVPDSLPDMPDSHSYIRTPTHRQPVTDYEMVREKAASQKRDVERGGPF